jgi:HD-GYP domain-containing protein (c-di-GMP phosphodiesterase class II)
MKHKISVNNLQIGMFVEQLDRPWIETPFLLQGFEIKSTEDIERVRKYCEHVYVTGETNPEELRPTPIKYISPSLSKQASRRIWESEAYFPADANLIHQKQYGKPKPLEAEIGRAWEIRGRAKEHVETMFEDIRMGSTFSTGYVVQVISDLTESVLSNPDAHMLLGQLRRRDDYAASHAMNVCSISLAFGRHLGLPYDRLNELGLGALLIDIGTLKIPREILNKKSPLTEEEYEIVKNHVIHGVEILEAAEGDIPATALDMVYTHQERYDGSGYPRGLAGDDIPLFARMVAIVDTYDAMTTHRLHRDGIAPTSTLKELYDQRSGQFDSELVEQFIQCLGIYPVGTLVLCSTDEVGLVIAQNPGKRLRPKLLLLLDKKKNPYPIPKIVDLSKYNQGEAIDVSKIIDARDYDIEVADYLKDISWAGE